MFTGLIEAVGHVSQLTEAGTSLRLGVRSPLTSELVGGESVCVNGVCLTVVDLRGDELCADVGPETARVTTLGRLARDQPVNLERAMRADGRFGGHFVQGHVDGVGTVEEVRDEGNAHWVEIAVLPGLVPFFVAKGSVAVDGVSLTVAAVERNQFGVMIIPFTWAHTNFASLRPGSRVNIECDIVGKYVARAVQVLRP